MIFDMMSDEWGHMMDWVTPNAVIIFLGAVSFITIVVILLFVLNRYTNHEDYLETSIDAVPPSVKYTEVEPSVITNYCSACGSKLDDRNSKFCPLCGTGL